MRKFPRLLSGAALLILAAWLCAFNDGRPVKAGMGGSRDSNYNNCSFTGCGGGAESYTFQTPMQSTGTFGSSAGCNISVTAGDFLFAGTVAGGSTVNLTSSTQAPSGERNITAANTSFSDTADWTLASTNAAFNVKPSAGSQVVAASWR